MATDRKEALRKALPPSLRRRLKDVGGVAYRARAALAPRARRGGDEEAGFEGVVILGMHRSGTSLVTRLVSLMGLSLCRDRDLLAGRKANPRGHWESRSLLDFDERLLGELGGAWFCPPPLAAAALARLLERHGGEALARLERAHPRRPWVWKDPRACVLMPFWSAVLGPRAAYVLVVRHPLEVVDSLARRDRYEPQLGLALWERYTRAAMIGAAGRPTMVCTYDGVLADPVAWCERLGEFLSSLGSPVQDGDWAAIEAFAMPGLRHNHRAWALLRGERAISPQQLALAEAAQSYTAQASFAPPPLPAETPATEAVFEQIRAHARGDGGVRAERLPATLRRAGAARREGPDPSQPPVSLVLAPAGAAGAEALAPTLPAGSEVLSGGRLPGAWQAAWREAAGAGEDAARLSLRELEHERAPGDAQALALGAAAARGAIVLLAGAAVERCDAWYEPAREALEARHTVAVAPAVRAHGSAIGEGCCGRAFVDEDLRTRPLAHPGGAEPATVGLLCEQLCAFDRRVLAAAGGVDGGFSSAAAALAELSVRLWRMGFRCCVLPAVEAWSAQPRGGARTDGRAGADDPVRADDPVQAHGGAEAHGDAAELYDRMRIATLHFEPERLRAFTERARRLEAYEQAARRLAQSDVARRRAAITGVCAFSTERYFESFPPASA